MYIVTIRDEGKQFVARDSNNTKRAWGDVAGFTGSVRSRSGRDLAEYLFHKEELGNVKVTKDGFDYIVECENLTD
jgi:hypothetical protein